ncbi:MAG: cytochrome c [Acidobacteriia bacterium]|nr:cytochrome c [Terriglobia bacterium]
MGPLLLVAALSCGRLHSSPTATVLAGVYTPAQARRGRQIFKDQCASCHGVDLAGFSGPPLKGTIFLDRWREFPLEVLFDLIKTTMPANNAGGLSHAAYLDVLAYLLESNEIPAGSKELTDQVAAGTRLVGKDGPQPLPTSAQVSAVGCLTLDTGNGWFLTHASEPERTFDTFEATPEELKEAAATPFGDELFRLANIDDLPHFDRDGLVDNKVEAKGILVRQPNNARINVNSLVKVGSGCDQ